MLRSFLLGYLPGFFKRQRTATLATVVVVGNGDGDGRQDLWISLAATADLGSCVHSWWSIGVDELLLLRRDMLVVC